MTQNRKLTFTIVQALSRKLQHMSCLSLSTSSATASDSYTAYRYAIYKD